MKGQLIVRSNFDKDENGGKNILFFVSGTGLAGSKKPEILMETCAWRAG
jgi:hypothetical protein